jgi:hypothetical protein
MSKTVPELAFYTDNDKKHTSSFAGFSFKKSEINWKLKLGLWYQIGSRFRLQKFIQVHA